MLLLILAAFQVAQCWWTLLTGAARSIAFRNRKKSIKDADQHPIAGTTEDGVPRGSGFSSTIRSALSARKRDRSTRQRLSTTSFHTKVIRDSFGMSQIGRRSANHVMTEKPLRLTGDGDNLLHCLAAREGGSKSLDQFAVDRARGHARALPK
jgi:hypothetical protein